MYKIAIIILLFLQACAHVQHRPEIYKSLETEIKQTNAIHLKECNCMKAFYRNLFEKPDNTSRYAFDKKVAQNAVNLNKKIVSVLAIGSGFLLNELTALANILANGKNLKIYLMDYAYVFYGDKDFKENALYLGNNPESIPENWKSYHFWNWAKNNKKPYLPFFEKHHRAIDEFKTIISSLDKIYNTSSIVEIIKPGKNEPANLPTLDMIIAIDAFIDIPELMWNLHYQLKLNSPVRFISLNKNKPMGGFWDSADFKQRESNSLKPIAIEIYDVISKPGFGSYKLIERTMFEATTEQKAKGLEFITDPERDSNQSPLDSNISGK